MSWKEVPTDLKLGTLFFFKLRLPKTVSLDFENFVTPTRANKSLLEEFTSKRDALRRALEAEEKDKIIQLSEEYLPYAFSLYQFNGLTYHLVNMPVYVWRNHLTAPSESTQMPTLVHYDQGRFEVIMVLHSLAAALCNKAYDTVSAPLAASARFDHLRAASKYYHTAAGIYLFLRDNLAGPWKAPVTMTHLEVSPFIATLLAEMCNAQIERLSIRHGILRGDSYHALCRLSVSAYQRHALMRQSLGSLQPPNLPFSNFVSYIFYSEVYQDAISYKLLGLSYRERRKPGKAISAMKVAIGKVKLLKDHCLLDKSLAGTPLAESLQETLHREFEETEIALSNIERFQMECEDADLEYGLDKIVEKLPEPVKNFVSEKPYIPTTPRLRDAEGSNLEILKENSK